MDQVVQMILDSCGLTYCGQLDSALIMMGSTVKNIGS